MAWGKMDSLIYPHPFSKEIRYPCSNLEQTISQGRKAFPSSVCTYLYTVKRPHHILLTKVQMWHGPGLNLNGHFQQQHAATKSIKFMMDAFVASHMPLANIIYGVEIEQLSCIV